MTKRPGPFVRHIADPLPVTTMPKFKKRKPLERTLETRFLERVGVVCGIRIQRKMNGAGARSWPDRQLFPDGGVAIFIEMKRKGEKPTGLQTEKMQDLNAAGYAASWFDDADEAVEWVRHILRLQKKLTKDGYVRLVRSHREDLWR